MWRWHLDNNIFKLYEYFFLIAYLLCLPNCVLHSASIGREWNSSQMYNVQPEYEKIIMRKAKSAEMRAYMNVDANPCDDFYAFACGAWRKTHPSSLEQISTGLFEEMNKTLDRKLERILKTNVNLTDNEIDMKVQRFYKACTDIGKLRDVYKIKLENIIKEFGDMPALSGAEWQEDKFDWLDVIGKVAYKYGLTIIIGVGIFPDFADNRLNRVYIGQQDFWQDSKDMYFSNHTAKYRINCRTNIQRELIHFLGINSTLAKTIANEIFEFETALAREMVDNSQGLDLNETSVLTTVQEMQQRYAPTINIARLVKLTLGETVNDAVYEFGPDYQRNLLNVINDTPKRIIANYVYYSLISAFIEKPAKSKTAQIKNCIGITKKYFAKNLDNMIYRRYDSTEMEQNIDFLWRKLKITFKQLLNSHSLKWIHQSTRFYALQKLNAMKLEINSYANENFTKEFAQLIITDNDFVENVRNILMQGSQQTRENLHQPPKPLEAGELLSYTPANIIIENTIKVPVSLLQPNYLYANYYPNAIKFGTLASLIAHEIIHGFDDSGRKFDKDGNMHDWWDAASTAEFETRTDCFANQYSQYIYNGQTLPWSRAQSENIADNGGVRLAYAAYLKWYENYVQNNTFLAAENLPDMNYTNKQLFFISYAQIWCNDVYEAIIDAQTSTDEHVPGKFRVIGPLSNFPKFAKAFNCSTGTPMNPKNKCQIY